MYASNHMPDMVRAINSQSRKVTRVRDLTVEIGKKKGFFAERGQMLQDPVTKIKHELRMRSSHDVVGKQYGHGARRLHKIIGLLRFSFVPALGISRRTLMDTFTFQLNWEEVLPSAIFWTSRGHRCCPFPPVRGLIFIAHRVQHSRCSSIFIECC